MDLPDPNHALGWLDIYRNFSNMKKFLFFLFLVIFFGFVFYLQYWGPRERLKKCESKNQELADSARHYEILLEFAKDKYPDLEVREAIDRLGEALRMFFFAPLAALAVRIAATGARGFTAKDAKSAKERQGKQVFFQGERDERKRDFSSEMPGTDFSGRKRKKHLEPTTKRRSCSVRSTRRPSVPIIVRHFPFDNLV